MATKPAGGSKPHRFTEEDREQIRASVLQRLRPESQDFLIRSGMTDSVFYDIIASLCKVIVETPSLKRAINKPKPATAPPPVRVEDTHSGFDADAKNDFSMTISRALTKGLSKHLTDSINLYLPAEAFAWRTAVHCSVCVLFNETQTLPGYDDAVASVNKALQRVFRKHNLAYLHEKGRCATSLPMALVVYWLPLGLWAMSRGDALRALRFLASPMRYRQFSPEQQATLAKKNPVHVEHLEREVLSTLKPKDRSSLVRFSKEVSVLRLYRPPKPLVELRRTTRTKKASHQTGIPSHGQEPPQWDAQKHKDTTVAEHDVSKWEIVSITGAALTPKW